MNGRCNTTRAISGKMQGSHRRAGAGSGTVGRLTSITDGWAMKTESQKIYDYRTRAQYKQDNTEAQLAEDTIAVMDIK
eukprot:6189277-Pleurochrysis_carterae.AAC.3